MSVPELLEKAQFVVDASGKKKSVLLDYAAWEALLTLLDDLEDIEDMRHLRDAGEEVIPWEQAKAELRLNDEPSRPFGLCAGEFSVPDDFDNPLPEYVIEDFEGKR
jgi:hypothetical protein